MTQGNLKEICFYYKYCNTGGVTSVIKNRMRLIGKIDDQIKIKIRFHQNNSGLSDFLKLPHVATEFCIFPDFARWCAQRIEREADTVHVVVDEPEALGHVGDVHGPIVFENHASDEGQIQKIAGSDFSKVRSVICVSQWSRSKLGEIFVGAHGRPIHVCSNFVDQQLFSPGPTEPSRVLDPALLWVGKLSSSKNLDDAFEILKRLDRRVRLRPIFVTGGVPPQEAVTDFLWRLECLGLGQRARWISSLPNTAMPGLLAEVRRSGGVLLSTSKFETFGLAVLEAMSCGVPVVAANVGGIRELVLHGEDGFLYPLEDLQQATDQILGLLGDASLYDSVSGAAARRAGRLDPLELTRQYLGIVLA